MDASRSSSTCITPPKRSISVFTSSHGFSSSMYLFASRTSPMTYSIASANRYSSIIFASSAGKPAALSASAPVLESNFSDSFNTRETRFPSPLARSALYFSVSLSIVISGSLSRLPADRRRYRVPSLPNFSASSSGEMTLPNDFDIFCPPTMMCPWMSICRDGSRPAERSIACHMADC